MKWYRKLHWQIILGMILGLIYGIAAAQFQWVGFATNWVVPFGDIFMNLLKLIAVPLVLTSLVAGVASLSDFKKLSRMGSKTIGLYIATTAVAVTIGLLVVNVLQPGAQLPEATKAKLEAQFQANAADKAKALEQAKAQFEAEKRRMREAHERDTALLKETISKLETEVAGMEGKFADERNDLLSKVRAAKALYQAQRAMMYSEVSKLQKAISVKEAQAADWHAKVTAIEAEKLSLISKLEEAAANAIRYNDFVIFPTGFPRTLEKLQKAGYLVREVSNTECAKLDGGMSCLSLRF